MTPAGTSNKLDVQNGWEENTHTQRHEQDAICNTSLSFLQKNASSMFGRIIKLFLKRPYVWDLSHNIGGKPTVTLYTYHVGTPKHTVCCVCVFSSHSLDIKFVGRTSRGYTGGRSHRISHPLSFCGACASIVLSRRIQPFLSLVDCEVGICVLTISFSSRWAFLVPSRLYP